MKFSEKNKDGKFSLCAASFSFMFSIIYRFACRSKFAWFQNLAILTFENGSGTVKFKLFSNFKAFTCGKSSVAREEPKAATPPKIHKFREKEFLASFIN